MFILTKHAYSLVIMKEMLKFAENRDIPVLDKATILVRIAMNLGKI